jgi:membrane-associated PAP2 superfamily phosphatase
MNQARRRQRALDGGVALLGLALLLAWDASGGDLALSHLYGDTQGFAWREQWFTRDVLHQGGRLLGFAVFGALLVNLWRPWTPALGAVTRWRWVGVTLLGLLLIPALKQLSSTSCPWDLQDFGGAASYLSHWRLGVADGGGGRCFPSGHATVAFAFLSGYFALRAHYPRAARWWLGVVCLVGVAFGWGQMARGAHFASHTMWTAWLCWGLGALLAPRPLSLPVLTPLPLGVSEG